MHAHDFMACFHPLCLPNLSLLCFSGVVTRSGFITTRGFRKNYFRFCLFQPGGCINVLEPLISPLHFYTRETSTDIYADDLDFITSKFKYLVGGEYKFLALVAETFKLKVALMLIDKGLNNYL